MTDPHPTPHPAPNPDGEAAPARPRRGGFGPTVLVGLLAGVVAAVGGNRPWADVAGASGAGATGPGSGTPLSGVYSAVEQASAPLVTALALVSLAAWGVVLVTRGLVRRLVGVLAAVVAVLLLGAAVAAFVAAPRQVRDAIAPDSSPVSHTAWAYVATVAALAGVAAALVAVARMGAWPEMGRRYDAPTRPGGAAGASVPDTAGRAGGTGAPAEDVGPGRPVADPTQLDLWRDIDEGRDPTDRP